MTKSKTTKRALIMSMISLLVCVSMLIGTTYAWFTDSVTSGGNQIVAGNLDIELYHKNATLTEAAAVQGATNLFPITLWEPGVYSYEVFTIKNIGNLALKYTLNALVTEKNFVIENGVNTGRSLLDVLYVKVLDGDHAPTARPAYSAADGILLKNYLSASSTNASGHILPSGTDHTATIVVYWPQSDNDNNWNLQNGKVASDAEAGTVGALTVKFAVNLVATQYTYEADSFDNQYDAQAEVPGTSAATPISTASEGVTLVSQTEDGKVLQAEVPAELAQELSDTVTSVRLKIDPNPDTETTGEITTVTFDYADLVDQNDNVIDLSGNTKPITVTLALGSGFANAYVSVYHDGELKTTAQADANGNVTYTTTHFCEITVKRVDVGEDAVALIGTTKYNKLNDAVKAANAGETILLLKDLTQNAFIVTKKYTLDLGGHTLTMNGHPQAENAAFFVEGLTDYNGDLTIQNGTLAMNGSNASNYGIYSYGNLTLKDLTINSACKTVIYVDGKTWNTVGAANLENVTINATNASATAYLAHAVKESWSGTILAPTSTLKNCTINSEYDGVTLNATSAVLENCVINAKNSGAFILRSATASGATGNLTLKGDTTIIGASDYYRLRAQDSNTITIEAGTYNFDPAAYLATGATITDSTDGIWTVTGPQTIGPIGGASMIENEEGDL